MTPDRDFDEFAAGDFVTFTRSFTASHWQAFASLSGDDNPLHWDAAYAAATRYRRPIVPLHLLSAPISAIAGRMIPGRRSLYLGCRVRALAPLFFDEPISYSASVAARHAPSRTLTLTVLGFRGRQILFDGEMTVQVRDDGLPAPAAGPGPDVVLQRRADLRGAVVTGAAGAIGREVVTRLAARGREVLAIGRHDAAFAWPSHCRFVEANLATASGRAAAARAVGDLPALGCLVHLASPPLDSAAEELLAVNFEAFRALVDAALPRMLAAQCGRIILVGSEAAHTWPDGLEAYAAAKAAATAFADHLWRAYSRYGVETATLAPGYVETPFSAAVRSDDTPSLLADEVAEQIVGLCEARRGVPSYLQLTPAGLQPGRYGVVREDAATLSPVSTPVPAAIVASGGDAAPVAMTADDELAAVVREVLQLPAGADLRAQALDITAGWDSLRHIELMLNVERRLGVELSASDIAGTQSYQALSTLVADRRRRRQ